MAKDSKTISNFKNLIEEAKALFRQEKYRESADLLQQAAEKSSVDMEADVLLARCQLALQHVDMAEKTYRAILDQREHSAFARGEAELALGLVHQAWSNLSTAKGSSPPSAENQLLIAAAAYKHGFIIRARKHLKQAVELGYEWEDNTSIDFVLQRSFAGHQYNDFEQIYLDAQEEAEHKARSQNRWFSLVMPIYDFFIASSYEKQKARAANLAERLIPGGSVEVLDRGESALSKIIEDFSRSEADATFGLEALSKVKEKSYAKVAELILGLQLEHLKGFAEFFSLSPETVAHSNLQSLVPLLPLRMAMSLILLYSASEPQDKITQIGKQSIDPNLLAGLIAISFKVFYLEAQNYLNLANQESSGRRTF